MLDFGQIHLQSDAKIRDLFQKKSTTLLSKIILASVLSYTKVLLNWLLIKGVAHDVEVLFLRHGVVKIQF